MQWPRLLQREQPPVLPPALPCSTGQGKGRWEKRKVPGKTDGLAAAGLGRRLTGWPGCLFQVSWRWLCAQAPWTLQGKG